MDTIFKALADSTRRALLDALRARDGQTLTELCESAEMTRFGVMKHLAVLEEASLVIPKKKGRFKYHYLNAAPLQEAIDRYIDPYRKPAARGLLTLKSSLEKEAAMAHAKPDFVLSTFIACTQDALWEALTDPEQMGRHHFMAERVEKSGETYTFFLPGGERMLTNRTISVEPKSRIEATFEPHWAEMPPSRQVFLIAPENGHCRLTVEHYELNFPVVPGEGVADGWARFLAGLKTFLETGEVTRFAHAEGAA